MFTSATTLGMVTVCISNHRKILRLPYTSVLLNIVAPIVGKTSTSILIRIVSKYITNIMVIIFGKSFTSSVAYIVGKTVTSILDPIDKHW